MTEAIICSKCGINQATPTHPWCKPCKAKYQREYEKTRSVQNSAQSFARGVDAMRKVLVDEFTRLGPSLMMGTEAAFVCHQAPRPSYMPNVIETESDPVPKT